MKARTEKVGAATLVFGDAAEHISQFAGVIDSIITDPPYGLGHLLHRPGKSSWQKLHGEGAPAWDKEISPIVERLPQLAEHCIIWGGNYYPLPPVRGWLIWDKIVRQFSSGHAEMAWTTLDQPIRCFNYSHGQLATEGKVHPTQKPVPLMAWCISQIGRPAAVMDPFMGSGTTGVACAKLGIPFVGIENDQRYFDIACERIAGAYQQRTLFQ